MAGKILAGTASWTDPSFVADWYPPDVRATDRLRWYAEHFSLVEVNSTFYRIPGARTNQAWCDQTPQGFILDVKLHRLLSRHSTKAELLPPDLRSKAILNKRRVELSPQLEREVAKRFLRSIAPLQVAGKLGALMLQLSPAFRPKTNQLTELDFVLELLEKHTLAIELRNRDGSRAGISTMCWPERNLSARISLSPTWSSAVPLPIARPRLRRLKPALHFTCPARLNCLIPN